MTWPRHEQPAIPNLFSGASSVPVDLSSFSDHLSRQAPQLLPVGGAGGAIGAGAQLAHGTTIVALNFPGGVVIAGDRRATQGNMIANRDVKKVYITDDYTATGIAGTAAIAVEFARLYAVELEHYEKLEGVPLTFARQGQPAGDHGARQPWRGDAGPGGTAAAGRLRHRMTRTPESAGRIVSFDAAGGWNIEEEGYQAVGSGSIFASRRSRSCISKWSTADSALRVAVEALYDAADDDSATGGPDLVRGIYPTAVDHQRRRCRRGAGGADRRTGPRGHRKPFARPDTFGSDRTESTDARGEP